MIQAGAGSRAPQLLTPTIPVTIESGAAIKNQLMRVAPSRSTVQMTDAPMSSSSQSALVSQWGKPWKYRAVRRVDLLPWRRRRRRLIGALTALDCIVLAQRAHEMHDRVSFGREMYDHRRPNIHRGR